ncbi:MAG TPA: aldo/keto reductase [Gemmatimonadales bacterium]|nr:aldo/keto reductase [Gemmatimonadales bacterium]
MRSRPLAPGLPSVSVIGLGGMPLSIQGRPDETTARAVVHAALDVGVTLLDTADVYCFDDREIGHNERLLAAALRDWAGPRDRVLVATKGGLTRPRGAWVRDGSPRQLRLACERSLRALGVEQLALYQLHAPDPAVPFESSVATLAALQREGKVRWIGLSNVSVAQIRAAEALVPIATVQNRLSLFFREALTEGVVAYCTERKLGFLAYSPVGGRRLNQQLPQHTVLRRLSGKLGRSPHAIATAWVLAQGPTVFAIPGARSPAHALDAASSADLELSREDLQALDTARFERH